MTIAIIMLAVLVLLFLVRSRFLSFAAQKPEDYASTDPDFRLKEHLNGPILCEGVIYGPTGKVATSFVAQMEGKWDGETGTLSEDFSYSNGRTQMRKWHLTLGENNTFSAEADDIIGTGKGVISGSTVMLKYTIELPKEAGGHKLDVTDWMYLTENGTIMNRSEMRKFGIKVAELVATMRSNV